MYRKRLSLMIVLVFIVSMVAGCKGTETEEADERYNIFTVSDLGQTFKSIGLKDAENDFTAVPITLIGEASSVEDDSFELTSDYITITVDISSGTDDILQGLTTEELNAGTQILVDGILTDIDIICESDTDKTSLLAEYEETTRAAREVTTAATTITEVTTSVVEETTNADTGLTSAVTEEPTTEGTTSIDDYAVALGISLTDITIQDAPLQYRIRNAEYSCTYTAKLTSVTNISLLEDDYTGPIYEQESYTIPDELTADELLIYAKEKAIADKESEIQQTIEQQEEAERARLNKMTIAELTTYIKGGCDGTSVPEPNVDAYTASSLDSFIIENNSIMGLSDSGKQLTTLVVPDMIIPDNTALWDDIKEANVVEELIFQGRHFTETKVKTPETEAERKKREYNNLPEPYTLEYSSDFNVKTAALKGCTSLRILALPYGVQTIGSSAFADCINLEYVKMPTEVFVLEGHIFDGCNKLQSLIMPETIRNNYNTEVLYNMGGLKNLIFTSNDAASAGIVDEYMYMFKGCDCLERVAISNTTQFDRSRLENAYKGLDNISFKFTQKAEVVEDVTNK